MGISNSDPVAEVCEVTMEACEVTLNCEVTVTVEVEVPTEKYVSVFVAGSLGFDA
jgi:hypothetical protein